MKLPSKATLRKYGLSASDYVNLYTRHGGCCYICRKPFQDDKRNYIDHEHLPKWKTLTDDERRATVRGLLCFRDNFKLMQKGNDNLSVLRNAVAYLEEYEKRRI